MCLTQNERYGWTLQWPAQIGRSRMPTWAPNMPKCMYPQTRECIREMMTAAQLLWSLRQCDCDGTIYSYTLRICVIMGTMTASSEINSPSSMLRRIQSNHQLRAYMAYMRMMRMTATQNRQNLTSQNGIGCPNAHHRWLHALARRRSEWNSERTCSLNSRLGQRLG